ncbi:Transcriptional regulatory protein ZraR [Rubripirellula amarantea]|uniref:Transcriptional regulatory protein ZraR n=1 Tax=Rubripirellula amarantea TaxID=2527999 RepID=A0A5C5WIA6_9BACT|nr:Transcriptional regulatory protein ZraR [Rubripirellula amarantea]
MFRLSPPAQAILGRSSQSQIVLRSERASRQHARIYWHPGDRDGDGAGWMIEDLGSRNGTFVDGTQITAPTLLTDPVEINVAGFTIRFTHHINAAPASEKSEAQATDDQLTMEFDPSAITDRRSKSRYLENDPTASPGSASAASAAGLSSRRLLQLAFALARTDSFESLVEETLNALDQHLILDSAGVYASQAASSVIDMPLVGTRQNGTRSYRRPPDSLLQTIEGENSEATLARNILGDSTLATENSRGVIDVESLIIAPVRDTDAILRGFIHVTTTGGQDPLSSEDLEFVVAAAQILAESIRSLGQQVQLSRSLDRSRKQVELLQRQVSDKVRLVGRSKLIRSVIDKIGLAAPTNTTILVRGESGVGKELVAAALHHASTRRDGPLVCLNCAALSPTLLESELFGHEKGAFTGATDQKAGKFETADTGTLMLDEIGEMSAEVQAKFLRVLEGHAFERVGGHESIKVDVRVVAATNRDLQDMVRQGTFRQDLYYRLNVVEIVVPPLRERADDALLIADYFLNKFNLETGRKIEGFTAAAKRALLDYSWPGNIRELKNVVERAVVLNTKNEIDVSDLALSQTPMPSGPSATSLTSDVNLTLAELERAHIERVLRHTEGNKTQAAKSLGIERSTLDRKLKRWSE